MQMQKKTQKPKPRKELIAASHTTKLPEKERSLDIPFNAAAANSGNYNYEQGMRDLNAYRAAWN
jgi:hypothetical protein